MTHYRVEVKVEKFGIASDLVEGLDAVRTFANSSIERFRQYPSVQDKQIVVNIWNASRNYNPFSPDKTIVVSGAKQ